MGENILNTFYGKFFSFLLSQSSSNDKANIINKVIDILHEFSIFVKSQLERMTISSSGSQRVIRQNKYDSYLLNLVCYLTFDKSINNFNNESSGISFACTVQNGS